MTPGETALAEPLAGAKILTVDSDGTIRSRRRADLADLLRTGDLLIANDAATIPASLTGIHSPTGRPLEIRLAGRPSLRPDDVRRFVALAFGGGDWHTTTEDREPPPPLHPGDRLLLGPLRATVTGRLGHARLVGLGFDGEVADIWAGLALHGRPIQYAHLPEPLALWDVWTPLAAQPVAFEPPSAGFALRWGTLARLAARGIGFATLTHAAGISSTGDPGLDARLPLDEPYHIPLETVRRLRRARREGGRILAVGTTVVRALEHAALATGTVRSGTGTATQRIGPATPLRVVDGILTGVHEPATSHYQLLRALADDRTLAAAERIQLAERYRSHEFGDSVLLWRSVSGGPATSSIAPPGP
jgi:S-adenosylmethionine:tRNA ribosyltransferase-isomerase